VGREMQTAGAKIGFGSKAVIGRVIHRQSNERRLLGTRMAKNLQQPFVRLAPEAMGCQSMHEQERQLADPSMEVRIELVSGNPGSLSLNSILKCLEPLADAFSGRAIFLTAGVGSGVLRSSPDCRCNPSCCSKGDGGRSERVDPKPNHAPGAFWVSATIRRFHSYDRV